MSIDRLIRALEAARLDLSVEDFADALWLARFLPELAPAPSASPEGPVSSEEQVPPERPPTGEPRAPEAPAQPPEPVTPVAPLVPPSEQRTGLQGVPLRVPAALALPDPLGLGRALRPLHRRVYSRRTQVLDEAASAEQIAETSVWLPVLRPEQVRWLELALVVDTSTSMALWRQTLAELRDLLQFHGAFRNVRVWRLPTDSGEGELRLLAGLETEGEPLIESPPEELLDPQGRRLVMVVSDCVSRRWHTGEVPRLLELWGRAGPVVLLQVLPEQHWGRTALRNGPSVILRASLRGGPNAQLLVEEDSEGPQRRAGASPPVPVVTLEPASLVLWAKLVAGGSVSVLGFELRPAEELPSPLTGTGPQPSPQERLEGFLATASPPARKLAGLMAAVPVSLPVMNLIRETLVPEARQEHLAEVFLGGLLREPPGQAPSSDPEDKLYDFWPGVRELLLDSLPAGSARTVLLHVSDFIESRLGQTRDFRAFLVDPTRDVTPFVEQHRAFATLAAHVLQRLGGAYTDLAQRLTTALRPFPKPPGVEVPGEQGSVPHPDDWAVVIGIDDYEVPSIYFHQAGRDAHDFSEWLLSPKGGGLPESQVSQLSSPTSEELEEHFHQWFRELSRRRKANQPVGRRLYLLLSGLGGDSRDQKPALHLANLDNNDWAPYVSGPRWAEWALRSGMFQEVVLLMNCSRQALSHMPEEQHFPRFPQLPTTEAPLPGNYFFGFSTSSGENPYGGSDWPPNLFTEAILDGLSGAAADAQRHVTAAALAGFVSRRMKMEAKHQDKRRQTPEFQWGSATGVDFVITEAPGTLSRVSLRFHRAYWGLKANILNTSSEVVATVTSAEAVELELPRGSYRVELPQIAWHWSLEVSEPQVSLPLDWSPSGLWVLVAGSAKHVDDEQLRWACDAIGETLARAGHGLLIGKHGGVDRQVLQSFKKTLRAAGIASLESCFEVVAGAFLPGSPYQNAIQRADAVLLLRGGMGTQTIFEHARAALRPVLPLEGLGGASRRVHKQLRSDAFRSNDEWTHRMLEALLGDIESPEQATALAGRVAEVLQKLPAQKARSRWPWLSFSDEKRLRQWAEAYDELRSKLPQEQERSALLDELVAQVSRSGISPGRSSTDELVSFFTSANHGERIVLLGLLLSHPEPSYFDAMHEVLVHSISPFEQYTVLRVLEKMLRHLGLEQLSRLQDTLTRLRDSEDRQFPWDSWRATQRDVILQETLRLIIEGTAPAVELHEVKGKVDFAIITLLHDEFIAVLDRFPGVMVKSQNRSYWISRVPVRDGSTAVVAVARASELGLAETQALALHIIDDLDPHFILRVGVGVGVPGFEHTLGDVVLSMMIHYLEIETGGEYHPARFALDGNPLSHAVTNLVTANPLALQGWDTPESIGRNRPPVHWSRPEALDGDDGWKKRVVDSLAHHFGPSAVPRGPVVRSGSILCSDTLINDPQALEQWLGITRKALAVDMEATGVLLRATTGGGRAHPFIAILGMSDIVGFHRQPGWTDYACRSAAAFTLALVRSGLITHAERIAAPS